jgi:hypothetical protein
MQDIVDIIIEFLKFHFVLIILTAGIYLLIKLIKLGAN